MSDVFISYSRKDTDFVRRLFDALEERKRQSWVDWKGIDYSTKWWQEICEGIDHANNFVIIISPDALNSKYCHDEITYARKHNKRIIPFVYTDLDEEKWRREPLTTQAIDNWEYLKSLQFISYPKFGDFDQAVAVLVETADKDPKYVQMHTELLAAAQEWLSAGKSPGFLLRDDRLTSAEAWLQQALTESKDPAPTDEQRNFISASRQLANTLRKQFRQVIAATVGLVVMVIIFALASVVLFGQATDANHQAGTAVIAQERAVAAQGTSAAQVATATVEQGKAQQQVVVAGATLTSVPPVLTAIASALADSRVEQDISISLSDAMLKVANQRPDTALKIINDVIEKYPNKALVYLGRALIYTNMGQSDKAIADYDKALELEPNDADTHYNRGFVYGRLQQYDKAIADYDKTVALDPTYSEAYFNRGIIYYNLGQYEKAIADYDETLKLDPTDSSVYTNRGIAHRALQQYDQAIADYNRSIQLAPNNRNVYLNLGNVYADLQQYDKALANYNKALEVDAKYVTAYSARGSVYYDLGKYDKAIAEYGRVLELDPNNVDAYYFRGTSYYALEQDDKAIADFTAAIQLNPQYQDAYLLRGTSYYFEKHYAEALADWKQVEALGGTLTGEYVQYRLEAEAALMPTPTISAMATATP